MSPPELSPPAPPLGVVLAGGQGRRLGGGGKALREVGGRTLVELAVAKLQSVCPRVVVVTSRVTELAGLPVELIADHLPGEGPLAALATALWFTRAPAVLVLAVDLPLARTEFLSLLAQGDPTARALVPVGPEGFQPLMAWYSRACLPMAQSLLAQGERKIGLLVRRVAARKLGPEVWSAVDPEGESFFNVNYPEDLAKVRALIARRGLFDTPLPA
ncbi:MAG: molybdenum cofactor guanylyltransferase [Deltaproteobacteria bacterium]|nr:molybdenum cofactor guanylyltransferase [Deltaproteobacteria bacterium]